MVCSEENFAQEWKLQPHEVCFYMFLLYNLFPQVSACLSVEREVQEGRQGHLHRATQGPLQLSQDGLGD